MSFPRCDLASHTDTKTCNGPYFCVLHYVIKYLQWAVPGDNSFGTKIINNANNTACENKLAAQLEVLLRIIMLGGEGGGRETVRRQVLMFCICEHSQTSQPVPFTKTGHYT
jgi:hypothetical protein